MKRRLLSSRFLTIHWLRREKSREQERHGITTISPRFARLMFSRTSGGVAVRAHLVGRESHPTSER
jgi:hypothetical protein